MISSRETVNFIQGYVVEIDGLEERKLTADKEATRWEPLPPSVLKINFDEAFHQHKSKAALGVVVRNE